MIKWKDMTELLVVSKLDQVLTKWFGTEMIFTDNHYKIRSKHLDRDYQYKSNFLKVMMNLNYGHEYMSQDIERIALELQQSPHNTIICDTFFTGIKCVASRVVLDGEYIGSVMAYPVQLHSVTSDESEKLIAQLKECGAKDEDITVALEGVKKLDIHQIEYLKDLVDLVGGEINTFHDEISKREDRIQELNSELGEKYRYHTMIGKSKKMQAIYRLLEKISLSESSVFIQGENGTGKELVAKAVHFFSPRKDNLFLAVNCSAFNDNLLDSELFGHMKGSFTGAIKDKKGLFEMAHGGTLFLDEIGDTSLSMQVKLLRVLQEGTYLPVGATAPKKVDVRIIAATNKNIKEMMAKGEFREDLYYRINVINVQIPSLKERADDIPILMDHFVAKKCEEMGVATKTVARKTLEKLLNYPWPGNVRELENEMERVVVLSGQEKMIMPDMLSPRILDFGASPAVASKGINFNATLKEAQEELEKIMIKEGLKRCNFNKSKLAKELGMSRASLIMKVEKYGLDRRISPDRPALKVAGGGDFEE